MANREEHERRRRLGGGTSAAVLILVAALLTGCGGSSHRRSSSVAAPTASPPPAVAPPSLSDFPAARGQSLQVLANQVRASAAMFGQADSVLQPGRERLAFGLLDPASHFLYAKTAVYLAARPADPAQGPFLAPLDSMVPARPYQSRTVISDPAAVKAIYEAIVRFPHAGKYAILALSRADSGLAAATGQVTVVAHSPIPDIGQRPPKIDTPTAASVHGDLAKIDTRIPPDAMHQVDFKDVIGRRPVALLFATPALCQSRTCGPVTDLLVQLQHQYGSQMTFIHNEVYVDNQPQKGYQPQLRAFHLQTEPWLFTFDRRGRVAGRLEGAFGIDSARAAVKAALR